MRAECNAPGTACLPRQPEADRLLGSVSAFVFLKRNQPCCYCKQGAQEEASGVRHLGAASPVRVCHERLVNPPHDCQAFACPAWPRRHYNGRAMAEELNLDRSRLSFAVVVARFNEAITSRLLDGALGAIKRHGVGEHAAYWVPSSFELPVAAKRVAATARYDAATGLGAARPAGPGFTVTAVPRFAGKSTLMNALHGLLPPGLPVRRLDGSREQMLHLNREASGGYVVVAEIGQAPVPGYIWGDPVRELFETLAVGYSLATALHAPDVTGAFDVLYRENGVSDEAALRVNLVLHLLRFGEDPDSFWRRVAEVSEIDGVSGGRPNARVLFRWREPDDAFEDVEVPRLLKVDQAELEGRARAISERVRSGRTDAAAISELIRGNSP